MKYYEAINTGYGFLTSEDRTGFIVEGKPCDIWVVEDNLHSETWALRVGATEITQGKAEMLWEKFDLDHPKAEMLWKKFDLDHPKVKHP